MKLLSLMAVITALAVLEGCAGVSNVEREALTAVESREAYASEHPDSRYVEHIRNGEIVRGMIGHEVIASWGMPNVYLISRDGTEEFWIYYVQDPMQNSVMVYSLCFDPDNVLSDWEIDMKRFSDYTLGYHAPTMPEDARRRKISIEKR